MLRRRRALPVLKITIIGLLLMMVISTTSTAQEHPESCAAGVAEACKSHDGTWLKSYWECEYADRQWCAEAGGRFEECASACRHNPDPAAPCTMQCVPLCIFAKDKPNNMGKIGTRK